MDVSNLIQETIAQHIISPKVLSYTPTKLNEVQGRFVSANRVYNFVLNKSGVSYSPAGQGDSLLFSGLFLERLDAVKRAKIGDLVGKNICNSGKSYQCGKSCISNHWKCHKGVRDVNDARRIASILASTNQGLKKRVGGEISETALNRGNALHEARNNRLKNGKPERQVKKSKEKKVKLTKMEVYTQKVETSTPDDGWFKSPNGQYAKQVLDFRDDIPRKGQGYLLEVDKTDDGWFIYGNDHGDDDIAYHFNGKNRWKTRSAAIEAADEFGESFNEAVKAANEYQIENFAENNIPKRMKAQLTRLSDIEKKEKALTEIKDAQTSADIRYALEEAGVKVPRRVEYLTPADDPKLTQAYENRDTPKLKELAQAKIEQRDQEDLDDLIKSAFIPKLDNWVLDDFKGKSSDRLYIDRTDVVRTAESLGIAIPDKSLPLAKQKEMVYAVLGARYEQAKKALSPEALDKASDLYKDVEKIAVDILWDDPDTVKKKIDKHLKQS
jgi:hypothetical protein